MRGIITAGTFLVSVIILAVSGMRDKEYVQQEAKEVLVRPEVSVLPESIGGVELKKKWWFSLERNYVILSDTQITRNFRLSELWCAGDSGKVVVPNVFILADILQRVRDIWMKPLRITSATRTLVYNQKIGGAVNSYHTYSAAADVGLSSGARDELIGVLVRTRLVGGIIEYRWGVHVDMRTYPRFNKGFYIKRL